MTTLHGLAADNVLEFEVLTAAGEYLTANANTNPDLFWALAGGGPNAFAVILSTTFRAYEDVPSSGAILNINSTHTTNETLFWEAVTTFHSYANHFVDSGLYGYYELGSLSLHIQPLVAINQTTAQLDAILTPLFTDLTTLGLPYSTTTKTFPTLHDLYLDLFQDEGAGSSAITGGWAYAHADVAGQQRRHRRRVPQRRGQRAASSSATCGTRATACRSRGPRRTRGSGARATLWCWRCRWRRVLRWRTRWPRRRC